jgi:polysaccharide export outer membrane protein
MNHKTLCRIVLAIFLVTAVYAYANQGKSAASTLEGVSATTGPATAAQAGTANPELHRRNPRYQLCKGDVLDLVLTLTPEFNQTVTVQPDGYITLLGVGDLHVEGETIPDVTQSIRGAYATIAHDPIITVRLRDFEKPYFIAGGEVGHPGKYELRGDTTLVQAVAIAGGFTEASKHSQVWLFRRVSNDWVETQQLDLKKMLKSGNLREDLQLRPGDMLYVPKNTFSKVKRFLPVVTLGTFFNPLP